LVKNENQVEKSRFLGIDFFKGNLGKKIQIGNRTLLFSGKKLGKIKGISSRKFEDLR
jgi:hypothetical protein